MKYSEILRLNNEFKKKNLNFENQYQIFILTNIIVNPIKEILEFTLNTNNINPKITFSNFDNIIQESAKLEKYDLVIVFWEFNNFIDGFQYSIENIEDNKLNDIYFKIKKDIDFVLDNLKNCPIVFFNEFTNKQFDYNLIEITKAEKFCNNLNKYLHTKKDHNLNLVNINDIFLSEGVEKNIDRKFYYNFKALYTHNFFYKYTQKIMPQILSIKGKSKKAIIFDCDNTLWHGLVGENEFKKIEMNTETTKGKIFHEIQNIILAMITKGVIVGICSKNNEIDVLNIINNEEEMLIKKDQLSAIKINWQSKDKNLKEIAQELNIGLESIVFVDDSKHEIDLINNMLPEVYTMLVPKNLYDYPNELINLQNIFFKNDLTDEDKNKTKLYNQQNDRINTSKKFLNINEYLLSLETKLEININKLDHLERLTQITQKTNQFNLTTKRYSKTEMETIIKDNNFLVFSLNVKDKFGIMGLTGIAIIQIDEKKQNAEIESLMLSCRIIGREIEFYFIDNIIENLKSINIDMCKASFIKTDKNLIVEDLYDKIGFNKEFENNKTKIYNLKLNTYSFNNSNLCEVKIEQ